MQYNCLLIINLKVENKSDQLLANLFIINVLKKFHFKDCIGNQSLLTLHKNEWDTQLNIMEKDMKINIYLEVIFV